MYTPLHILESIFMNIQKINSATISGIQEINRRLKTINPDDTISRIMDKVNQPQQ